MTGDAFLAVNMGLLYLACRSKTDIRVRVDELSTVKDTGWSSEWALTLRTPFFFSGVTFVYNVILHSVGCSLHNGQGN